MIDRVASTTTSPAESTGPHQTSTMPGGKHPLHEKLDHARLSDRDLLDAWVTDRCRDALDAIVHRYALMVLSVCRRRCRTSADADDAMQTTFLYLAKSAKSIRHPDRLAGWLQRVAQRASVAIVTANQREAEPMMDMPVEPNDPLERLTQRHEAIVLDEELADLPNRYRSAIVLHFMEDQSLDGVAKRMDTTVGAVRGYIQRGKKLLAKRLRGRGITPIIAWTAATAWTADISAASQASTQLLQLSDPTSDMDRSGDWLELSESTDFSCLEQLLQTGITSMSMKAFGSSAVLGVGACLIALATTHLGGADHPQQDILTIQSSAKGMPDAAFGQAMLADMSMSTNGDASGAIVGTSASGVASAGAFAGVGMRGPEPDVPPVPRSSVSIAPAVQSKTAFQLIDKLDAPLPMRVNQSVAQFARELSAAIESPVFIDEPALKEMGIDENKILVRVEGSEVSTTRSVLREALHPHGLRAVIEEDGLLLTIDWAEQTQRGLATDRWLDVSRDDADSYDALPQKRVSLDWIDAPLVDITRALSEQIDFPILLDRRALDEIGVSEDSPITLRLHDITLGSALNLMLRDLDLTYAFRDEALIITTVEANAERLRNRAYYVEDIVGLSESADFSQLMQLIQTTVEPDAWEALGGASTMFPMSNLGTNRRSALIVSTSDTIHHELEMFLAGLRGLSKPHDSNNPSAKKVSSKPVSSDPRNNRRRQPRSNASSDDPFSGQDPFGAGGAPSADANDPFGKPSASPKQSPSKPSNDPFGQVDPGSPSADDPFEAPSKTNPFG